MTIFTYLEKKPIIEIKQTVSALGLAYNTVSRFVLSFCELGILRETSKRGKTRIYSYKTYLDILRQGT